jgi:periplasmic protein CpxP/Spy
MNNKIRNIIITSSLCSALVISGISVAKDEGHDMSGHKIEKIMKRMVNKLDLTAVQQTQVAVIKKEGKAEILALKPKMKAFREQVKRLMDAENFDEQAFKDLHSDNQDMFAAKALIQAKSKFKMKQVLTTTQLAQLKKMRKKRKHRS